MLVAALGLLAVAAAPPSFTVTGTVSWAHPKTCDAAFVAKDAHVCGASGPVYRGCPEVDAKGRVGGAVVYLEVAKGKKAATTSVLIDQVNCSFVPRIAIMGVGSIVRFTSSDPVLHNVRILDAAGNTLANHALLTKGQRTPPLVLSRPGRYEVVCEAGHTWMNAHLFVFAHRHFAETGPMGAFKLPGVPPGAYKLVAWHPDLGRVERDIVVSASLSFSLELPGMLESKK